MRTRTRLDALGDRTAFVACLVLATLVGCATRITQEGPVRKGYLPPPNRIVVHDFAYQLDQITPESAIGARLYALAEHEPQDERSRQLGEAVATELSKAIVSGLREIGFEAVRAPHGSGLPMDAGPGDLEIEGQFLRIDEGNRLRRVLVGLGMGKSNVATQVQIYDSSPSGLVLVQSFSTYARSIVKPGAAPMAAAGPIGAGVAATTGLAMETVDTARSDASRTGGLIVRHLAELAYQRGWIDAEQARKVHVDVNGGS